MSALIHKLEKPVLILAGALALTFILMQLEFNLLEANLYDFRMSHSSKSKANTDIVLISIDDHTTKLLNEFSPLPLDLHVRFLEALERFNPKAVGYLVDMNRVNDANPDLFREKWGDRFVEAASRLKNRGIPVLLGTPFDVTGEVMPPYPLSSLPHSIAIIHKDGNVFSEDKVTRRAFSYLYDKPAFHVELAQQLGALPRGALPKGSFYLQEVDGHFFFFRYQGQTAVTPEKRDPIPYKVFSFVDLLAEGKLELEALDGKIVLIGTLTKEDSADFAFTPYSKTSFTNPKLVVHANILDSVLQNDTIRRVPNWVNWATTFTLTAFVVGWVMTSTPLYGVFVTLGLIFVFLLAGHVLFSFRGLWIKESQPLIGIFVGYYLMVPYRLILEYKKRWDYQRKNEILTQVEELKTNFLSLVTHDLKTPVARIQGLAEVLMRKASERLVDRDRETLQNIISSTDELNRFISSILELNRVDSNRIQLNLESKDINQIIERTVEGLKAQCRAARIKIQTNLEPLFPIKVDATLMTKVLNNLVDNAVKYSPPGSEVLIESKEVGDTVEVLVKDRGIGLSEKEIENLFTRFYRAKNNTTAKVPGTGLGLYLTRYFVEAHRGKVQVQSELNKGSTFKIVLPLQLKKENENGSSLSCG